MSEQIYTLTHKEYVTDILTAPTNTAGLSAFQIVSFYCNPGNAFLFPWGSTIALNYSNFKFRSLKFTFVSTSATALNSTNTALGLVFGRSQLDSTLKEDTNSLQMLNSYGTHQSNPSQSWEFVVDLSKAAGAIGTVTPIGQPSGLPSNEDSRLFFPNGFFEIATQGMQANNVNIGQLYCTYVVDLMRPVYLQGELGYTIRQAHLLGSGVTNLLPLGTTPIVNRFDTIGITCSSTVIQFPKSITTGVYEIQLYWVGAGTASVVVPSRTYTNCSLYQNTYVGGSQAGMVAPPNSTTSSTLGFSFLISINAPGAQSASITFGTVGTLPVTGTTVDIIVTQQNGLYN